MPPPHLHKEGIGRCFQGFYDNSQSTKASREKPRKVRVLFHPRPLRIQQRHRSARPPRRSWLLRCGVLSTTTSTQWAGARILSFPSPISCRSGGPLVTRRLRFRRTLRLARAGARLHGLRRGRLCRGDQAQYLALAELIYGCRLKYKANRTDPAWPIGIYRNGTFVGAIAPFQCGPDIAQRLRQIGQMLNDAASDEGGTPT